MRTVDHCQLHPQPPRRRHELPGEDPAPSGQLSGRAQRDLPGEQSNRRQRGESFEHGNPNDPGVSPTLGRALVFAKARPAALLLWARSSSPRRPAQSLRDCWFGTPPATPTRTATAAPPPRRCSTPAPPTWPSTASHELLNSKHKSSSLAGIARTAAFGQRQPLRSLSRRDCNHPKREASACSIAASATDSWCPVDWETTASAPTTWRLLSVVARAAQQALVPIDSTSGAIGSACDAALLPSRGRSSPLAESTTTPFP